MPKEVHDFGDGQIVYAFQKVGGPAGYYDRQHDRVLIMESKKLTRAKLSKIFKRVSKDIERTLDRKTLEENGTTAVLSYLGTDNHIITASLGDSRSTLFVDKGLVTMEGHDLSVDHNVYNQSENKRLIKSKAIIEGGRIWTPVGSEEIYGLAITRSFGDYMSRPHLIDTPEIHVHDLHQDEFMGPELSNSAYLAVTSDGVHMELSPIYRANALEMYLKGTENTLRTTPEFFANLAISCGSGDNLSVAITEIEPNRTKNIVMAVFDGHGKEGYKVAEAVANAFRQELQIA